MTPEQRTELSQLRRELSTLPLRDLSRAWDVMQAEIDQQSAEIARLQQRVDELEKDWPTDADAYRVLQGTAAKQVAEITRLREENERLNANWLTEQKSRLEQSDLVGMYSATKAKAEIARLNAIIAAAREQVNEVVNSQKAIGGEHLRAMLLADALVKLARTLDGEQST